LRSSDVYLRAVWLHRVDGANDVLIPIAQTPKAIRPNTPYTEQQLTDALLAFAQKRATRDGFNLQLGG